MPTHAFNIAVGDGLHYLVSFRFEHERGNISGYIYHNPKTNLWNMPVRFRYYVDDNVGQASNDRRDFYEMTFVPGKTAEDARGFVNRMVTAVPNMDNEMGPFVLSHVVDIDGDAEKFIETMLSDPACHITEVIQPGGAREDW